MISLLLFIPFIWSLQFIATGDWGNVQNPSIWNAMKKTISKLHNTRNVIDFILSAGDNVYEYGLDDLNMAMEDRDDLSDLLLNDSILPPIFASWGNHDYRGNKWLETNSIRQSTTSRKFNLPTPNYYFFKDGVLLIIFDSWGLNRDTITWLNTTISKFHSSADFIFLSTHVPLYSISTHGNNNTMIEQIGPILKAWCIDIIFTGHDHNVQVFYENHGKCGTWHILSGSGGKFDSRHGDVMNSKKPSLSDGVLSAIGLWDREENHENNLLILGKNKYGFRYYYYTPNITYANFKEPSFTLHELYRECIDECTPVFRNSIITGKTGRVDHEWKISSQKEIRKFRQIERISEGNLNKNKTYLENHNLENMDKHNRKNHANENNNLENLDNENLSQIVSPQNRNLKNIESLCQQYHIFLIGDSGKEEKTSLLNIGKNIKNSTLKNPDCATSFLLGDNFYQSGVNDEFDHRLSYLNSAIPTKTVYGVLGNHDYRLDPFAQVVWSISGQYGDLKSIAPGDDGGSNNDVFSHWYLPFFFYFKRMTINNSIIYNIVLDTNVIYEYDQIRWLNTVLERASIERRKNNSNVWILVYGHHPIFSVGEHGDASLEHGDYRLQEDVLNLLLYFGVDLYIAGHEHDLEHIVLNRTREYIYKHSGGKYTSDNVHPPQELNIVISGASTRTRPILESSLKHQLTHHAHEYQVVFAKGDIHGFVDVIISEEGLNVIYYDEYGHRLHGFTLENPQLSLFNDNNGNEFNHHIHRKKGMSAYVSATSFLRNTLFSELTIVFVFGGIGCCLLGMLFSRLFCNGLFFRKWNRRRRMDIEDGVCEE